jgi:hypothetical protein
MNTIFTRNKSASESLEVGPDSKEACPHKCRVNGRRAADISIHRRDTVGGTDPLTRMQPAQTIAPRVRGDVKPPANLSSWHLGT